MNDFNFHKPQDVAAAVATLKKATEGKYLGGGQSLLPVMKLGLAAPTDLVSLAGLPALKGIRVDGKALVIGAGTTHAEVAASPEVKKAIPALAALAEHIGDPQVRNRGTLGGSLAHNDPSADYPAAVLALNATIQTDRRTIPADAFFQGMYQTALKPDEVITAVRFDFPEKAAYAKFPHPASKFALIGVMVAKLAGGVRVAVTGAGPGVYRVPDLEKALAGRFAAESVNGVKISAKGLNADTFASADYRAHLVSVMARRAVAACQ